MHLSALYRFPLKSGMSQALQRSEVGRLGLDGDRRWLVVDEDSGRFLTQRLLPAMTRIEARYDEQGGLRLGAPGRPVLQVPLPDGSAPMRGVTVWKDALRVPDAGDAAAQWLSDWLGRSCRLVYMPDDCLRPVTGGEVDDRVSFADGFPLLLIGQASLEDLSGRVGRPLEMLRFRPNLVVEGASAYAEDDWTRIRIGDTSFRSAKGCSRCIMTTLDPVSGERNADREPLTTLKTYREREGQVYFGQNLIPDGDGVIEVGMPVEILD